MCGVRNRVSEGHPSLGDMTYSPIITGWWGHTIKFYVCMVALPRNYIYHAIACDEHTLSIRFVGNQGSLLQELISGLNVKGCVMTVQGGTLLPVDVDIALGLLSSNPIRTLAWIERQPLKMSRSRGTVVYI